MGFDLDLLFKVTEVKLQKHTQCDTASQLLPASPPRLFQQIKLKLSHVLGTHRLMCTTPLEFRSNSRLFPPVGRYVPKKLQNVCWCIYKNLGFWAWPSFQGHGCQTSKIYTMWYNFATIVYISINFSHWIHLTTVCTHAIWVPPIMSPSLLTSIRFLDCLWLDCFSGPNIPTL
jgi:hypothetical protein